MLKVSLIKSFAGIMIVGIAFISGCDIGGSKYIEFTHGLRDKYDLDSDALKSLQFYVSEKITLHRELEGEERDIVHGKLVVIHGKNIDRVIIDRFLPGICVNSNYNSLAISFKEGTALAFGCGSPCHDEAPYGLYAKSWNNSVGELSFQGKTYYAVEDSGCARLMIDKSALYKFVREEERLKGLLIGETKKRQ